MLQNIQKTQTPQVIFIQVPFFQRTQKQKQKKNLYILENIKK
jgi:hypothetical protein